MDLLMTGADAFLTIDAGGTYLKSAVMNSEGEVLKDSSLSVRAFSSGSKEKILATFRETILQGLKSISNAGMRLDGIGVAFPGPFDCIKGIPLLKHKFVNIYGVEMRKYFHEIPGISPYIPICFTPDSHAVLSGELWKGNAQGFQDAAVVTLGTGLGFAFSKNGIIQSNNMGGPLVTIYKLPYKDGTLEDHAGRMGFLRKYREISAKSIKGIDVSDLGKWANEGDKNSIRTFHEVGKILAEGIHDILIERGIRCLLLGGQISMSFHHMEKTFQEGLADIECLQKISVVKSIENAPLFGALRAIGFGKYYTTGLC